MAEWLSALEANGATRNIREHDLRQETRDFLLLVIDGLRNEAGTHIGAEGWEQARRFLEKLTRRPQLARWPLCGSDGTR
ncbi:hypothetical protein Q7K56_19280 [Pseudomonas putida]|nr:hypothetical protein [Pseudomonas putida]